MHVQVLLVSVVHSFTRKTTIFEFHFNMKEWFAAWLLVVHLASASLGTSAAGNSHKKGSARRTITPQFDEGMYAEVALSINI